MFDLTFELFFMLGISLAIVIGFMFLLWIVYVFKQNMSIMDIGWCTSFILSTLVYFALGDGYFWRRLLVLLIVSIWALRLAAYLIQRFHFQDDLRYQQLVKSWNPQHIRLKVLALFLLQGFLVIILSLPFALMSRNILPFFSTGEIFGLLIWMGGVLGESIADEQLLHFKQDPTHAGKVLDKGLWRYSRHPNYFFEWVIWIAYFVMAISSPGGWLAILSPMIMLYFLLAVSGVPMAEQEALQTKGEAYRTYQRHTSSFFPWFRSR